jgi:hypothetical protein
MTAQEIYDKVKAHLLKHKKRSTLTGDFTCAYRSSDQERSCAIGCLIPDYKYSRRFEYNDVRTLVGKFKLTFLLPEDMKRTDGVQFLGNLQTVHDAYSPSSWDYHLADVALTYGLEP